MSQCFTSPNYWGYFISSRYLKVIIYQPLKNSGKLGKRRSWDDLSQEDATTGEQRTGDFRYLTRSDSIHPKLGNNRNSTGSTHQKYSKGKETKDSSAINIQRPVGKYWKQSENEHPWIANSFHGNYRLPSAVVLQCHVESVWPSSFIILHLVLAALQCCLNHRNIRHILFGGLVFRRI